MAGYDLSQPFNPNFLADPNSANNGGFSMVPNFGVPNMEPPFSNSALQGLNSGAVSPAAAPPRSPFTYQPWSQSKGVGDYLGGNAQLFGAGINALSKGFGIYAGLKNLSLAKKSFHLQRDAYQTNLANQTRSYNTQVSDRIAGRSYATEEERQAALAAAQIPSLGG